MQIYNKIKSLSKIIDVKLLISFTLFLIFSVIWFTYYFISVSSSSKDIYFCWEIAWIKLSFLDKDQLAASWAKLLYSWECNKCGITEGDMKMLNNFFKKDYSTSQWSDLKELQANISWDIPAEIWKLCNLEYLSLFIWDENILFPLNISNLNKLKGLHISWDRLTRWKNSQFTRIPKEIFNLKSLRSLSFRYTNVEKLPNEIENLKKLEVLTFFEGEKLNHISDKIWQLSNLRKLTITKSNIKELPNTIWNLSNLELLNLKDNELQSIPEDLSNLKKLKGLYLYWSVLSGSLDQWIYLWNLSYNFNVNSEVLCQNWIPEDWKTTCIKWNKENIIVFSSDDENEIDEIFYNNTE